MSLLIHLVKDERADVLNRWIGKYIAINDPDSTESLITASYWKEILAHEKEKCACAQFTKTCAQFTKNGIGLCYMGGWMEGYISSDNVIAESSELFIEAGRNTLKNYRELKEGTCRL